MLPRTNGYSPLVPVDTTAYPEPYPHILRWARHHGPRSLPGRLWTLRVNLAMFADADGYIREDQDTLAILLRMGRTALQSNLRDLRTLEQLEREQDPDLDGHHNRYRFTGYRTDWQPMDDPDDDGTLSPLEIVAADRDRYRRRVEELERSYAEQLPPEAPETEHTLRREEEEEEDQQHYQSDDTSSSSSSAGAKARNPSISREAEIEAYLKEHGECIVKAEGGKGGWANLGAAMSVYANDLDRFERERRLHLLDHEAKDKAAARNQPRRSYGPGGRFASVEEYLAWRAEGQGKTDDDEDQGAEDDGENDDDGQTKRARALGMADALAGHPPKFGPNDAWGRAYREGYEEGRHNDGEGP